MKRFSTNCHFDWLAPIYDLSMGRPDVRLWEDLFHISERGGRKGRLLDAGGGTGRVAKQLGPLFDQGAVLLDPSLKMLLQLDRISRIIRINGEAELLPFGKETFDGVMVVDALHHFKNQQGALFEIARVLCPGGRLIVEEPDIDLVPVKGVAVLERLFGMRSHFHRPSAIAGMIEKAGLTATIEKKARFRAWIAGRKPI